MRIIAAVMLLSVGCASSTQSGPGEPTTAAEKQRREPSSDDNASNATDTGHWGGWRYQGDRQDCFFVVGRRCFKTEQAACNAAACKTAALCDVVGGGPATVSCKQTPPS